MKKTHNSLLFLFCLTLCTPSVAQQNGPFWTHNNSRQMDPYSGLRLMWDEAESKAEKKKIESLIAETLEKQFDADMEAREAELEKVEKRIARLREQLDERRRSRDDVVELKAKEIVMDWQGLGWTTSSSKNSNRFGLELEHSNDHHTATGFLSGLARTGSKKRKFDLSTAINLYRQAAATKNDKLADIVQEKLTTVGSESSIDSINSELWETWESYSDKIDSTEFWKTLAEFGDEAVTEMKPEGQMRGLIQDTVAHLYYEAGDLEKAYELQVEAAEHADGHQDIREFLKKLKSKLNKDSDDELELDDEDEDEL